MEQPTIQFDELQQRLKAYKQEKEQVEEVESNLKPYKERLSLEATFLAKEIIRYKLDKIELPNVGTFSAKSETKIFFPNQKELVERKSVVDFLIREVGLTTFLGVISINPSTLTGIEAELKLNGKLKENSHIDGIKSNKVEFKLGLRKK